MTRVLLVEDTPADRRLVAEYLRDRPEIRLESCSTVAEALRRVGGDSYDCAIVDLALPDARGLEAVEQLRIAAPMLPLVVLTDNRDERLALRAVQAGVQDFLSKSDVRAGSLVRALRYAIARQRSELQLARLALHDPLTGLANRRLFGDRLDHAIARRARTGGELAVLFADLDDFKAVNDAYGHDAGDDLLRQFAGRLLLAVRTADTVARFGGDEFTVLCEQVASGADALQIARRVLRTVEAPFELPRATVEIRMSLGVACAGTGDPTATDLLRRADQAMYRAKAESGGLSLAETG